ncbi:MAG TPA: M20/M25/M40 family metallo-hydrolase [Candidatus Deferrimicrobiaceae bacterium]|jgi:acetylornithine deacetylase/succinyl-diaminopimelate desuccinylase-like protein
MNDPVLLLQEYIRIDTANPPGDCRAAAAFLCRILSEAGLSPVMSGATPEKPNVLCHVGGTEEPGLVLVHHMDVVPAQAEEWSVPPFSAEIRDGFLYGRGALDTKNLGIAHLCAALAAREAGLLRRKLFFIANADEEVGGGEGAEYFARNLPFSLGRAVGMNEGGSGLLDAFGPGKFFLVNTWEKGPLWLTLSAEGKAGHGSRPSPQDAPGRLARAMARIAEHRDPPRLTEPVREMLAVLYAHGRVPFDPATLSGAAGDAERLEALARDFPEFDPLLRNTFAVTTLSAGFKPNVIPSRAEGTVDARILPGEAPEAVAARLGEMVREFGVSVEIAFSEPPSGSPSGPLFDAVKAAVLSVHPDAIVAPYLSTGFTDSRFYRQLGIDMYGLAPILLPRADLARIHGVDERIPVDAFRDMVKITQAMIAGWNGDREGRP